LARRGAAVIGQAGQGYAPEGHNFPERLSRLVTAWLGPAW
jgi:hypothetical protein